MLIEDTKQRLEELICAIPLCFLGKNEGPVFKKIEEILKREKDNQWDSKASRPASSAAS